MVLFQRELKKTAMVIREKCAISRKPLYLKSQQEIKRRGPNPSHFHVGSSSTYPNFAHGWVNVKDVALAHILAYEVPSADGRYCIVERVAHYFELDKIIGKMYPNIPLPYKCGDDDPLFPTYQVSKGKIRSLGIDLIPLETSIKETIESLKEKGFFTF